MRRRSFIATAAGALLAILFPGRQPPKTWLRPTFVWRDGDWVRVRMTELHRGEIFAMHDGHGWIGGEHPWFVAECDPKPLPPREGYCIIECSPCRIPENQS